MIDLTELKRKKTEWNVTNGIKWKVENSRTIKIVCPKCGEVGKLVRVRRGSIVAYRILHGSYCCRIGWTDNSFDAIDRIYYLARRR